MEFPCILFLQRDLIFTDNGLLLCQRRKRKDWEPTRHTVLCSAHFEEDCFPLKFRLGLLESSGKTVKSSSLEEDAVPTIFNTTTTPTMSTPTMLTPRGKRPSSPETDLTTPKTVKRPRSAFVKRDIQRLIREYEEREPEDASCPQAPTHIEADDLSSSMEVTVVSVEPKTKSVASQKSLSRPSQRSHYTQTRYKGKDKDCCWLHCTSMRKFRENRRHFKMVKRDTESHSPSKRMVTTQFDK
ncbi:uncharacterized protein LOC110458605 [Mizuhopecten yessoensis]|uniref:uncharacterized protein LOC110458605 n=1 Tax=Mizuhopecten yessoensis TaxID=6573 RepID=UPI000B45AD48|nr:uncharacterized protein LOC110458605 [Mizuhopecten yessoensis]